MDSQGEADTHFPDTPTPGSPQSDTLTPNTTTPGTPTSDTPRDAPAGPENGSAGGGGGEAAAQHAGGDAQAAEGGGGAGEAEEEGSNTRGTEEVRGDARGEAAEGTGGDVGGTAEETGGAGGGAGSKVAGGAGGDVGGTAEETGGAGGGAGSKVAGGAGGDVGGTAEETGGAGGGAGSKVAGGAAEDTRGAGGDAGSEVAGRTEEDAGGAAENMGGAGGDVGSETARAAGEGASGGAGGGPAAAGSTRVRQEPNWLQDEEDELWPEFPPCSSPGGATSPTSPLSPTPPTAGMTEGLGGSHRSVQSGGPPSQVPPGTAGPRPRSEGAGRRLHVSARAQGRSAILEKFGGAATGPAPHLRRSGGAASVKAMLLEWCRARTRGYQHVDVQNFSGSWGSGLAFCALLHSFFPDAFDYGALEPGARHHNLTLAFATAEERAGCPPLLDVQDLLRLRVPDAKCVYTYVQELYRCLVAKGLVKTKKR